jgi:uncharacterized protein YkvS
MKGDIMPDNKSEVARLLNQIEAEYCAGKQGLTGLAECARHSIITTRMENMRDLHVNLYAIVGEEAIRLIAERLDAIHE